MRESSTTWTVTIQPLLSLRSSPSTASIGRPSSCGRSRRTRAIASRPDSPLRLALPFRCSAITRHLLLRSAHLLLRSAHLLLPLGAARLADRQTLQQLLLLTLALLKIDLPVLIVELQLQHFALDDPFVVKLPVRLIGNLLCDPCHAPHRGEGQCRQAR